jgi:hypothetical protein
VSELIPCTYDPVRTSRAEQDVFLALRDCTDGYVVLHSLQLAQHVSKVFGEIDFVVIGAQGIACLEVKGGDVSRRQGLWHYGRTSAGQTEGPFGQVQSACHSLRRYLTTKVDHGDPISRCLYASGVVTPDVRLSVEGPDIVREVLFDASDCWKDFRQFLQRVYAYWEELLRQRHGMSFEPLGPRDVRRLTQLLRGDFGLVPALGDMVTNTERSLLVLTEEQVDRLRMADQNPRVLLFGTAGTGKTLLSLEHAVRRSAAGRSVLFLCYNRNLRDHIAALAGREHVDLLVQTLHGHLLEQLKESGSVPPRGGRTEDEYFTSVLPEAFLSLPERHLYDEVVVDEGQDLLREEYVLCLDALIRGGLAAGSWHICYDPNQNIYNPAMEAGLQLIRAYGPTMLQLDTNCRNTMPIGIYATLLTGGEPARRFLAEGIEVVCKPYQDSAHQRRLVRSVAAMLVGQGVGVSEICILSPSRLLNSCLESEAALDPIARLVDIGRWGMALEGRPGVRFSTIQGYKGLESSVVLLIDVEGFYEFRPLNYTAITRARAALYIFYSAQAESEMNAMVAENSHLLDRITPIRSTR